MRDETSTGVRRPAIFASAFHPHLGGVEEVTRQLATEQRRRGRDTLVVTQRWPKSLPAESVVDGVPVWRVPFSMKGATWRHWGGYYARSRRTSAHLNARLAARGTDLVHVQCVSSNGLYALRAAEQLDLPLIVSMHGELSMDADRIYETSPHLRAVWRALLDRADVITACSRYSLEEAEQAYGMTFGSRGSVMPNGIRLEDFDGVVPEKRARPYVLGLGRMVHIKGFDLLIDAFALADLPGTDLVLAGDGPELPALKARAAATAVADRIHFLGGVPHDRAVQLFAGAELFVLPSRHEPQGIVLLEAMACGTPVLAADVGGVTETLSTTGFGMTFRADDVCQLSELLARHEGLVATNRAGLGPWTWEAVGNSYAQAYDGSVPEPAESAAV